MSDYTLTAGVNLSWRTDGLTGYLDSLLPTPYAVGEDATYSDIQSAIDQAVTDGADSESPVVVWITPGTYEETVTLPAGILLHAEGGVTINGNIKTTATDGGVTRIGNIDVISDGTVPALSVETAATIIVDNCSFTGDGAGATTEVTASGATFSATRCRFTADGSGESLLVSDGETEIISCTLSGPVQADGGSLKLCECALQTMTWNNTASGGLHGCVFDNDTSVALTLNGTGEVIAGCLIRTGAGSLIGGENTSQLVRSLEAQSIAIDDTVTGFGVSTVQAALEVLSEEIAQAVSLSGSSESGSDASSSNITVPSSSVAGNFVTFSDTTGSAMADSGSSADDFAAASHTHAISEITDLQDTLDAKADTTDLADKMPLVEAITTITESGTLVKNTLNIIDGTDLTLTMPTLADGEWLTLLPKSSGHTVNYDGTRSFWLTDGTTDTSFAIGSGELGKIKLTAFDSSYIVGGNS